MTVQFDRYPLRARRERSDPYEFKVTMKEHTDVIFLNANSRNKKPRSRIF